MAGKFEIYRDKGDKFRFRFKAGNGEIIAVSEAYESKAAAKNGVESVKRNAANAKLADLTVGRRLGGDNATGGLQSSSETLSDLALEQIAAKGIALAPPIEAQLRDLIRRGVERDPEAAERDLALLVSRVVAAGAASGGSTYSGANFGIRKINFGIRELICPLYPWC
jgi:uncharacterized protein